MNLSHINFILTTLNPLPPSLGCNTRSMYYCSKSANERVIPCRLSVSKYLSVTLSPSVSCHPYKAVFSRRYILPGVYQSSTWLLPTLYPLYGHQLLLPFRVTQCQVLFTKIHEFDEICPVRLGAVSEVSPALQLFGSSGTSAP